MNIEYKPKLPESPRPICIIGASRIVKDAHLPEHPGAGFVVAGGCDLHRERAQKLATP